MLSRRDLLKRAGAAAALSGLSPLLGTLPALTPDTARAPLDLLVLGGTGFIGPHLVRHAVSRGHRVSIFTRGRRTADIPESVIRLQGDRNGQLGALEGKKWDAVFDDSATNPEWVRLSTALLKDNAGAYLFTSSTGVHYPYLKRGLSERDPILYEAADQKDGSATYGAAKAQCERITMDAFGDRGIVVRPTYIVGPGDTSDRFPYWPQRIVKGGETLAPGKKDDPMQIVDVRDLAEFMVKLVEDRKRGVYEVAGPAKPMLVREFYPAAAKALGANPTFVYVDDYAFLKGHEIIEAIPWALLEGNDYGQMSIRNEKAIAAGLRFRPLDVTVRDTLAWWETVPEARKAKPRFDITPEKEGKALADWRGRRDK
jgi:2'-hydroxyisoflavone reductase